MTSSRRQRFSALLLCLLLAVAHTWPLATAPGTHSRNDNGDAQLNEWILAWVAHQLPRAPARLFDANIFYPARDTLAYSEPLIVPGIMAIPIRALGGSPVLAFNLVLIAGFALTAWAGWLLVSEWTGSSAAGLLAGSVLAFNTHMLTRLAHVQGIHAWGLPLALRAADRLILSARVRDAVLLAIWMAALAYTSGYLAVFGVVLVAVVLAARIGSWRARAVLVLSRFAIAAGVGAVAVLPLSFPYQRVAREQRMVRSIESVGDYSLTPKSFITSAGRLHYRLWSAEFFKEPIDPFFPGVLALALSGIALVSVRRASPAADPAALRLRRQRVAMLVVLGAAGVVLSMGTRTPIYGVLYEWFPPMQGLRAAARFANLFLLSIAALAGFGLAAIVRRVPAGRATWAGAAAIAVVNVEALRAPFPYTPFEGIPAIYDRVAELPGRVVLAEVPFYPPSAVFLNAYYVLNSTAHFRPLMNGYSGYLPDSYRTHAEQFRGFPDPHAVLAMRRAGATHVMVHANRFPDGPERGAQILDEAAASPQLERVAVGRDGVTLFRLR